MQESFQGENDRGSELLIRKGDDEWVLAGARRVPEVISQAVRLVVVVGVGQWWWGWAGTR